MPSGLKGSAALQALALLARPCSGLLYTPTLSLLTFTAKSKKLGCTAYL